MILNNDYIKKEYELRRQNYAKLIEDIKYIIIRELDRKKIKIHHISDRLKPFDSFLEKIKRKDLKDPFNEIHDLFGLRIICLFLDDIEEIGKVIINNFDVFDINEKISEAKYDVFGYMAAHYKARLKPENISNNVIKHYTFEIQVRTIAQDAWASISHYLFYKHDIMLPEKLKRDFYALIGLFYIADTHFSLIRSEQYRFLLNKLTISDINNNSLPK